jgi:hypothetical protein
MKLTWLVFWRISQQSRDPHFIINLSTQIFVDRYRRHVRHSSRFSDITLTFNHVPTMEPSPNAHGHPQPLFADERIPMKKRVSDKAAEYHQFIPGIRKLPLPVFGIILIIAVVNALVWVGVGVVLVSSQILSFSVNVVY